MKPVATLLVLATLPLVDAFVLGLPARHGVITASDKAWSQCRTTSTFMQAPKIKPPPKDDNDGLPSVNPNEDSVDLDFDATTVVALLGAAIAFNFFVLANL